MSPRDNTLRGPSRVRPHTPPAAGGHSAAIGTVGEYEAASLLIYDALRSGNHPLQWIRVTDPSAGQIDDIQIGTPSRVDAYQVKWRADHRHLTWGQMVQRYGDDPPLFAQLADGWKQIKQVHRQLRVVVHLLTNSAPSPDSTVPTANPPHSDFGAFYAQAWKQRDNLPGDALWQPAWDEIQRATGLTNPQEFQQFLCDCELDVRFGTSHPEPDRDELLRRGDLEVLFRTLLDTAASPSREIHLERRRLLELLGWDRWFAPLVADRFSPTPFRYEPLKTVVARLNTAIDSLDGGYLALVGPPGSGKSTLLSETSRGLAHRVIRYFVYVPDEHGSVRVRGSSGTFLHYLVVELERCGFRAGLAIPRPDREQLLPALTQQLAMLHDDYNRTGRKTIIIIDGLDHIRRAGADGAISSLLDDLPMPEEVRSGVYFILGTQTTEDLPPDIRSGITAPRSITMEPLSRPAALRVIADARLPVELAPYQAEWVYSLSAGHPLALVYVLNHLTKVTPGTSVDHVLANVEPYTGNLSVYYNRLWLRMVADDEEFGDFIGMLARIRLWIDLAWVETWAPPRLLRKLEHMAHYFRMDDGERWYFFHSSFQQFLVHVSTESPSPQLRERRNRHLHRTLAQHCADSPAASLWRWEELHHRLMAGDESHALALATSECFDAQFGAFRSADAILADVEALVRLALTHANLPLLARYLLIASGVKTRLADLDHFNLVELLVRLHPQLAVHHIREGNRLLRWGFEAMDAAAWLFDMGMRTEAQRIFELAEPLDLLGSEGNTPVGESDYMDLMAWANAAVRFRPVASLCNTGGAEQAQVLYLAGRSLTLLGRTDELQALVTELERLDTEDGQDVWFWLCVFAWEAAAARGKLDDARALLEHVLTRRDRLTSLQAVTAAEGIIQVLGNLELARATAPTAVPMTADPSLPYYIEDLPPGFRAWRLHFLFQAADIASGAPMDADGVLQVAAFVWAASWRKRITGTPGPLPSPEVLAEHLVNVVRAETASAADVSRAVSLLLKAISQHGTAFVTLLETPLYAALAATAPETEWEGKMRQLIAVEMNNAGASPAWVAEQLRMAETAFSSDNISERLKHWQQQAQAWLQLGDATAAHACLREMVQVSLSLGDTISERPDELVELLAAMDHLDARGAADRIVRLAGVIGAINHGEQRIDWLALDLIMYTFRWSPRRAVRLAAWFCHRRVILPPAARSAVLRAAAAESHTAAEAVVGALRSFMAAKRYPDSWPANDDLLEDIMSELFADMGPDEAAALAATVVKVAPPGKESEWEAGLTGALNAAGVDPALAGLAPNPQPAVRRYKLRHDLILPGGMTLRRWEVHKRVRSVAAFRELFDQRGDFNWFDWEPVVDQLVDHLNRDELIELYDCLQDRREHAWAAPLIRRLTELGDLEAAWRLGEAVLQPAVRDWDALRRIQIAGKALIAIDPRRGRTLVVDTLTRFLPELVRNPSENTGNIYLILSLLAQSLPVAEIWAEAMRYLDRLSGPLPEDTVDSLQFLSTVPESDTTATALSELQLVFRWFVDPAGS